MLDFGARLKSFAIGGPKAASDPNRPIVRRLGSYLGADDRIDPNANNCRMPVSQRSLTHNIILQEFELEKGKFLGSHSPALGVLDEAKLVH